MGIQAARSRRTVSRAPRDPRRGRHACIGRQAERSPSISLKAVKRARSGSGRPTKACLGRRGCGVPGPAEVRIYTVCSEGGRSSHERWARA